MSQQHSKKLPETLTDFAKLANISTESLTQILEKLNQAGIHITDPDEKLSPQTKAKLLGFFRGNSNANTSKKAKVSNLNSTSGQNKTVKITTLTREKSNIPTPVEMPVVQEEPPALEKETVSPKTPDSELPKEQEPVTQSTKRTFNATEVLEPKYRLSAVQRKRKLEAATSNKKHKQSLDAVPPIPDDEPPSENNISSFPKASIGNESTTKNIGSLKQTFKKPTIQAKRDIWIPEYLTIVELSKKMSVKDSEVTACIEKFGIKLTHPNKPIDQETAALIVEEMGHHPRLVRHNAEEIALRESLEKQMGQPVKRPPIITIMGHVDHGKTSLLDYIKQTKVATKEAGGITQHIGAYRVELAKGAITFLDTPGHAAFTAMRARGARLTDIVALIVAADDGVMPQTIEAIEHAQAASVPIVVVINKVDKPNANIEAIQQDLAKYNLIPEDWGGDTLFAAVSAKTGAGVDQLLETLLLQAEISELTAPDQGPAQGIIIESRMDKGQGPVVTMIVQKGTLQKGDVLLAGTSVGRVRLLTNEHGKKISAATPSIPVEVLGLSTPPAAGEEAITVPNEKKAKELAQARAAAAQEIDVHNQKTQALDALMDPLKSHTKKSTHIILKADVQGSAEALKEALLKLSTESVTVKLIMTGVGTITESDVNLARASKAIILGFNVKADSIAKRLIQRENVTTHYYSIIYELLDEMKKIIHGLVEPEIKETIVGKALIREVFGTSKTTIVVGCVVTEGTIHKGHNIRILRNDVVIYKGKPHSLRRFKDDVKEVNNGAECGISIKNHTDLQIGDRIESYENLSTAKK